MNPLPLEQGGTDKATTILTWLSTKQRDLSSLLIAFLLCPDLSIIELYHYAMLLMTLPGRIKIYLMFGILLTGREIGKKPSVIKGNISQAFLTIASIKILIIFLKYKLSSVPSTSFVGLYQFNDGLFLLILMARLNSNLVFHSNLWQIICIDRLRSFTELSAVLNQGKAYSLVFS